MKSSSDGRPRVVHVLSSFHTGGMERVVASLVGGLDGYEHVLVCMSRAGAAVKLLPRQTPWVELRKPPGNPPLFLLRLAAELRRWRPDLVCTYNWAGMDAVLAAGLGRVGPVLHNEHGWVMEDLDGRNGKRTWVRRVLSSRMDAVVCVSKQMERWLSQRVRVRCPVVQIYNGVDTDIFRPGTASRALRRELALSHDAFLMGIVARLDPIKNHGCLFRAVEQVRRRHPHVHLVVVGDGPLKKTLQDQAGGGIHFVGERADVPEILRDLDLFVLPSLKEGVSMTILEAMAGGVPVVALKVGGNPEIVEDGKTGRLVEENDPRKLAQVLEGYVLDPQKGREQGLRGRDVAVKRFSLKAMIGSYDALYRSMLEKGRAYGTA
ncbi:sugar transferase, PEP-CTERM/EpsH1 system associated [Desulfacinum hydrothermale DSM 13146]|uniref:Sugar transferase, PEP-CTERM/EpsH1 system associated n=1 Tax=Desulfacinum hydrothermale DSM 13146 TaxID=1121390 RepID=A0A1W1XR04_9BACT|nr:glycosyltransferase [Desulfacinum hydrothermale]SMC26292.1 sugar transferase, PEP-CTERM/EpsH1 system associated [Desulfacinum hydrothermale DSM 13146]